MIRVFTTGLFLFLFSCAGYRLQNKTNPFAQYSIRSLSVPMFYNKSNLGNVSGIFSREILHTLTDYSDLEIRTGSQPADAVLIGIIETQDKVRNTILTTTTRTVESNFGSDVLDNKRQDFIVPESNTVNMGLRIIVIKHPTKEEIEFLQTQYGKGALSSKIIFNEHIPLFSTYTLKRYSGESTSVLGTQNQGVYMLSMQQLAKQAANNFRSMILYAF